MMDAGDHETALADQELLSYADYIVTTRESTLGFVAHASVYKGALQVSPYQDTCRYVAHSQTGIAPLSRSSSLPPSPLSPSSLLPLSLSPSLPLSLTPSLLSLLLPPSFLCPLPASLPPCLLAPSLSMFLSLCGRSDRAGAGAQVQAV